MPAQLRIEKHVLREQENLCEYNYTITNNADQDVYLDEYEVFSASSLAELGLNEADCLLLRTGRHKNDMPSAARFGVMDACMEDALGGMTESGDRRRAQAGRRMIVSDHLTLLGSGDNWLLLAFMTGRDQLFKTEITVDDAGSFLRLRSAVELHILIRPGQTVTTETFRLERTAKPMEAVDRFALDKAAIYGSRVSRIPSVFCTWYYYGLTVTWQDVVTNLERMEQLHLPFDVFQIDEGWEMTLGQWEPNAKFPIHMRDAAKRIREAGYTPGIWTSPFVASAWADVWKEHPEWMLRDRSGEPCLFPMNGTTYCVFDITHPGTWDYFEKLYRKLTFDWGYTYHKLDFTRASVIYDNAVYHDPYITLARAYHEAVAAIRRGMGEESYFLMCGGLYDPIIGLVDAQRSGSDVLSMWFSNINQGGKTAPYTIKQSLTRFYMNRWWNNDPDALMVRRNDVMERGLRLTYGLLSDDEVRTVVLNQFIGGGIVCSTEPLDKITPDRLHQLRHVLPPLPSQVEPVDLLGGGRFPSTVRVTMPGTDAVYIALINWDDGKPRSVRVTLDEATLGCALPEGRYAVCEFFSGSYVLDAAPGDTIAFADVPPHSAALIKVERQGDAPVIVASDMHFAMGGEFDRLDVKEGRLCFKLKAVYDYPGQYKVWLPDGRVEALSVNGFEEQEGSRAL